MFKVQMEENGFGVGDGFYITAFHGFFLPLQQLLSAALPSGKDDVLSIVFLRGRYIY